MSAGPEMRIGDLERDAAVRTLGEHYAAGRLTREEYDERSDAALRARTDSELRPLFVDLPRATDRRTASGTDIRRTARPRTWLSTPLLPILAVLAVLVAVSSGAWWLLFVLGWLFWSRPRHGRCH
jgi:hypothetical protein